MDNEYTGQSETTALIGQGLKTMKSHRQIANEHYEARMEIDRQNRAKEKADAATDTSRMSGSELIAYGLRQARAEQEAMIAGKPAAQAIAESDAAHAAEMTERAARAERIAAFQRQQLPAQKAVWDALHANMRHV